jgi:hypothetical protein
MQAVHRALRPPRVAPSRLDARAVVTHLQPGRSRCRTARSARQSGCRRGVLEGVFDQIAHRQVQQHSVPRQFQRVGRHQGNLVAPLPCGLRVVGAYARAVAARSTGALASCSCARLARANASSWFSTCPHAGRPARSGSQPAPAPAGASPPPSALACSAMEDSGVRNSWATSLASRRSRTSASCWRSSKVLMEATTDSNSSRHGETPDAASGGVQRGHVRRQGVQGPQAPPQGQPQGQRHHGQQPQPGLDHLLGNVRASSSRSRDSSSTMILRVLGSHSTAKNCARPSPRAQGANRQNLRRHQRRAGAHCRWPPPRDPRIPLHHADGLLVVVRFEPGRESAAWWQDASTAREARSLSSSAATLARCPSVSSSASCTPVWYPMNTKLPHTNHQRAQRPQQQVPGQRMAPARAGGTRQPPEPVTRPPGA